MLEGVRTLLFDLDGTLLGLDIHTFFPVYFSALARRFDGLLPGDRLIDAILQSTGVMISDRDRSRSNQEAFWRDFPARVGKNEEELDAIFSVFYREDFPGLCYLAQPLPEARMVLDRAMAGGYTLALATNPVFPRAAILERLRWGGIADVPFALITSYEDMHACKPHLEYYQEALELLRAKPEECLMVGNDAQEDMVASLLGMKTYLVDGPYLIDRGEPRYEPHFRGTLAQLAALL